MSSQNQLCEREILPTSHHSIGPHAKSYPEYIFDALLPRQNFQITSQAPSNPFAFPQNTDVRDILHSISSAAEQEEETKKLAAMMKKKTFWYIDELFAYGLSQPKLEFFDVNRWARYN